MTARERTVRPHRVDPVSLIVTALVAGASGAVKDVAGSAIKDAYEGLKSLLRRRFGREEVPELDDPAANRDELSARLRSVGADRDEELLRAAQAVMAVDDPAGTRAGKYDVKIRGGKGIVVGDHNSVTMTFEGD